MELSWCLRVFVSGIFWEKLRKISYLRPWYFEPTSGHPRPFSRLLDPSAVMLHSEWVPSAVMFGKLDQSPTGCDQVRAAGG